MAADKPFGKSTTVIMLPHLAENSKPFQNISILRPKKADESKTILVIFTINYVNFK